MELPGRDPLGAPAPGLVGLGVAGVVKVDPEAPLLAQEGDVAAVDDDDVVPAVRGGVVDGLVLAHEDVGDLLGAVEGVLPLGVVDPPRPGEGGPLLDPLEARHPVKIANF